MFFSRCARKKIGAHQPSVAFMTSAARRYASAKIQRDCALHLDRGRILSGKRRSPFPHASASFWGSRIGDDVPRSFPDGPADLERRPSANVAAQRMEFVRRRFPPPNIEKCPVHPLSDDTASPAQFHSRSHAAWRRSTGTLSWRVPP